MTSANTTDQTRLFVENNVFILNYGIYGHLYLPSISIVTHIYVEFILSFSRNDEIVIVNNCQRDAVQYANLLYEHLGLNKFHSSPVNDPFHNFRV